MRVVGRSVGWLIFSLALNTHVPFSLAASGGYSPFLPFFFVGPLRWELSVFQNSSTRTSHGPYDVISLFSHFIFFHSCFFFFFLLFVPESHEIQQTCCFFMPSEHDSANLSRRCSLPGGFCRCLSASSSPSAGPRSPGRGRAHPVASLSFFHCSFRKHKINSPLTLT